MATYIIEGGDEGRDMGNTFGVFRRGLLAPGRFAVVADGEYANGGRGPSTVDGVAYRTRERAEAALAKLLAEEEPAAPPLGPGVPDVAVPGGVDY